MKLQVSGSVLWTHLCGLGRQSCWGNDGGACGGSQTQYWCWAWCLLSSEPYPKNISERASHHKTKFLGVHAWGITSLNGMETVAWSNNPFLYYLATQKEVENSKIHCSLQKKWGQKPLSATHAQQQQEQPTTCPLTRFEIYLLLPFKIIHHQLHCCQHLLLCQNSNNSCILSLLSFEDLRKRWCAQSFLNLTGYMS